MLLDEDAPAGAGGRKYLAGTWPKVSPSLRLTGEFASNKIQHMDVIAALIVLALCIGFIKAMVERDRRKAEDKKHIP